MRSPVSFRLFTSLSQNLFVPSPHFSLRLHILHMPSCLRHPLCLHLSLIPSINLHLCASLTPESICGPFPDQQTTLFHVLWLIFKSLCARLNSLNSKLGGGSRSGWRRGAEKKRNDGRTRQQRATRKGIYLRHVHRKLPAAVYNVMHHPGFFTRRHRLSSYFLSRFPTSSLSPLTLISILLSPSSCLVSLITSHHFVLWSATFLAIVIRLSPVLSLFLPCDHLQKLALKLLIRVWEGWKWGGRIPLSKLSIAACFSWNDSLSEKQRPHDTSTAWGNAASIFQQFTWTAA